MVLQQVATVLVHHAGAGMAKPASHHHVRHPSHQEVAGGEGDLLDQAGMDRVQRVSMVMGVE